MATVWQCKCCFSCFDARALVLGFGFNWVLFSCEVCQFWSDSIFHYDYCAVCFGFLGYPVCERHFGIDPTANAVARANPSVLAGRTCDLNEAWYSILICVGSHDSTVHELTKAAQSLLIKLFFVVSCATTLLNNWNISECRHLLLLQRRLAGSKLQKVEQFDVKEPLSAIGKRC